jgi:hypothetical protein
MFVAIILLSDDHGGFRANPQWLDGQIWWLARHSRDPRETLATLSGAGLVELYRNGGQLYGHVTNWTRHQRVDKPSKPRIPLINDEDSRRVTDDGVSECSTDSRDPREDSKNVPETLAPDLRPPTSDPIPPTPVPNTACPASTPSGLELDGEPEQKPRRKAKRATQLPASWAPTDAHRELARTEGRDCDREATKFRDHAEATGRVMKDWNAAFRTWLRSDIGRGRAPKVQPTSGRDWTKTAKVNR